MQTYPTPPGHRMAYDIDGTKVFRLETDNTLTELTAENVARLNDDASTNYSMNSPSGTKLLFAFPELRDVTGLFWATSRDQMRVTSVEYSTNTTNLYDGDWLVLHEGLPESVTEVTPHHLTNIEEVAGSRVRALRFSHTGGTSVSRSYRDIHIYGYISEDQILDRLELWHPTEDQPIPVGYFDWGDTPRGTQGSKQFRVKNSSTDRTATNIEISLSALSDDAPSIVDQHSFERDGAILPNNLELGDLGPGHISDVLTIRYSLSLNAVLGPKSLRVHAIPSGWV